MIPLIAFAVTACLPISAPKDQITSSDLARALPEWNAIAPDTAVALAPVPGVVRILRIGELRRLAQRFAIPVEPAADLCYQRPVEPVPVGRMLEIMQTQLPDARIEILEPSRVPAPIGDLEFPLSGLRPGYWFGYVTYGAGHKFVVWARIRATVPVKRIVASADLKPGQPIDAALLRIETRDEFPAPNALVSMGSVDEVAGRIPRRSIAAGTVVQKQWLASAQAVKKGDTVKVEVVSGAARLEAEGIAEASGAVGETIPVQNPDSKRRFQARIAAPGRVFVKGSL